MTSPEDRQRLGDQVRRARGGTPLTVAAARAQVSPVTWRGVENGTATTVRATTYRSIEQALGWEVGSVARILEGGEPTIETETRQPATGNSGKVDHIAAWEANLIDEIWANPNLGDNLKEELTTRTRRQAAEARVIEDRLRRSAS